MRVFTCQSFSSARIVVPGFFQAHCSCNVAIWDDVFDLFFEDFPVFLASTNNTVRLTVCDESFVCPSKVKSFSEKYIKAVNK